MSVNIGQEDLSKFAGVHRILQHHYVSAVGPLTLDNKYVRRYLTYMRTTISTKGQIVLPAELRAEDDIQAGQEFEVQRIKRGEYRLVRRKRRNEGLVKLLLACPVKDFFVPIESESTDTLFKSESTDTP